MASESQSMECSDKCLYNAYLLRVLQKRNVELKAAYQHIVKLDCQAHNVKNDTSVQTCLDKYDVAVQTLQSSFAGCDECGLVRETVQKVQQQLNDSIRSVIERDSKLAELKKQLMNSENLISELRARVDAEEAARKVKEEQVEELEELFVVCKSESLATEQEQHTKVEISSREIDSLKSELSALMASFQAKEEALAQNMFEKDELEETVASIQATNASLLHQLDELRLQLKNQNFHFETEIQHLTDKNQQLMQKVQNLDTELARCQPSASASFGCSQPMDLLASQQSSELSAVKLELLTLQAEKDDLIQQLAECKTELSSLQLRSCQSFQRDSENNTASATEFAKPPSTVPSRDALESQNAALLGQLLVLEDQLSESAVLLQESCNSCQKNEEQLKTALRELSDTSTRVASLAREKSELETELSAAKTKLETSEDSLQECRTQLSLVERKFSLAGNRQRQLISQKQMLESQNCELLQKLHHATADSPQNTASLPSRGISSSNLEHMHSHLGVKENQVPSIGQLSVSAETFQRCGNRQVMQNASDTSECEGHLTTNAESHSGTAMSTLVDRRLVPCTASPATLLGVCDVPTSVHFESAGNIVAPLKRRSVDSTADTGRKRHFFGFGNQQTGWWHHRRRH